MVLPVNVGLPIAKATLLATNTSLTTAASLGYIAMPVAAGSVAAGMSISGFMMCRSSAIGTLTPTLRWGTTGALTASPDTLVICNSAATVITPIATDQILIQFEVTFRSATTVIGNIAAWTDTSAVGAGQQVSTSVVQTITSTSLNYVTMVLTQAATAGTITVDQATLILIGA